MRSLPLDGSPFPVTVAPGVTLTAPGVVGSAELRPGADWGGETRGPVESTTEFLEALSELDFRQSFEVLVDAVHVVDGGGETRTAEGEPGLAITVPAVGDDEAQIAMCVDEFGVVTWHLPDGRESGVGDTRAGESVTFTVERGSPAVESATADGDRGLVGAIGRKLISVFVVPLLEKAVGRAAPAVARHYENRTRPQGVLRLTGQGWTHPGEDPFAGWWLERGAPVLLFVHGTASSIGSGFRSLGGGRLDGGAVLGDTLGELRAAYQGQVFAFDHHTLSSDLAANAELFRSLWPEGGQRSVDIVTHSRGGLVARQLAASLGEPGAPLTPRRIVYVATPNGGTTLANPGTVRQWIDRMTTMLNLFPDGPWSVVTDSMASVLTVVRVVAGGAIGGLPGLVAMDPAEGVIRDLPVPADTEQYAISVDFEPAGRLLHWLRGADLVVDKVFGDRANDVVVPTDGVADVPARQLHVPAERRLELGKRSDIWHCSVFTDPGVHDSLRQWLQP